VFGLRDQVRGDPFSRTLRRDDDNLGGAGVEVDTAIAGDLRLRCRDVAITWTDDLVHARNRIRTVGQRRDRLCAADAKQSRDAGLECRRHDDGVWFGAHGDDVFDPSHGRRNRRHQYR
jgi:hypothetical protein